MAGEIIDPDSLTWVIVGDVSTIRPQLEGIDLGPVEVRAATGAD